MPFLYFGYSNMHFGCWCYAFRSLFGFFFWLRMFSVVTFWICSVCVCVCAWFHIVVQFLFTVFYCSCFGFLYSQCLHHLFSHLYFICSLFNSFFFLSLFSATAHIRVVCTTFVSCDSRIGLLALDKVYLCMCVCVSCGKRCRSAFCFFIVDRCLW